MNYAIKSLLNNKHGLQVMLMAPVLGILTFTGCSHIDGTAQKQPLKKNRVAVYSEWSQTEAQAADSSPDPGYEWFY
jgi:hypothetical protein